MDTGSPASDALFLTGENFSCADDLILVSGTNLNEVAVAAQLAAALESPLLFDHPQLAAEVGRLKPLRVHILGDFDVIAPPDAEILTPDIGQAVDAAKAAMGATEEVPIPSRPDTSTIVAAATAIRSGDRVVRPVADPTGSTPATPPSIDVEQVVLALADPSEATAVWMVDGGDPVTVLLSVALGKTLGAAIVAFDADDVLGYPQVNTAISGYSHDVIRFVGRLPEGADWELGLLSRGQQLPGGGFFVYPPNQRRRYVAFYGHPETTSLGVLGEQGSAETLVKMQPYVTDYAGDGSQVIPTFEIIAAVASAGAGNDENYSYEWPVDTFDDWVQTAATNDAYIVLDIQPGRADFLTQVKKYEDLLLLPFVGLGLDPEWRLGPSELPLQQIGSVHSTEINEVIQWLADLVKDAGLPQKLLLLHQFAPFMIEERELLENRPELQIVIQVDGDGREADKDRTWERVREGFEDAFWDWGWKNFFDEDEPGPPSPASTMGKTPSPVFVSYQ